MFQKVWGIPGGFRGGPGGFGGCGAHLLQGLNALLQQSVLGAEALGDKNWGGRNEPHYGM